MHYKIPTMQTLTLQNRNNLKINTDLHTPSNSSKGLTILLHGLGGFRTQPHMQTLVQAFLKTTTSSSTSTQPTPSAIAEEDTKTQPCKGITKTSKTSSPEPRPKVGSSPHSSSQAIASEDMQSRVMPKNTQKKSKLYSLLQMSYPEN